MKVICIDEKGQINPEMYVIPFGETVTVIGQSIVRNDGWYIKEYPVDKDGMRCSYNKKHFAEVETGIDELELIEQRLCTA